MTNSQIDKLGRRLKEAAPTEDDLRLLDEYRASFAASYQHVMEVLRTELGVAPTGRQAKTTASIVAKIRREHTRLSRMQDIAGCRITVENALALVETVEAIESTFTNVRVEDRIARPSHGYRAIHAIVRERGKSIEVQLRTELQHLWAEMSEKFADVFGAGIKYGEGPKGVIQFLAVASEMVYRYERAELEKQQSGATNVALTDERQHIITVFQEAVLLARKGMP
jgi:ppGpp synthetase/RelA/SpoT-type nucleotidyltranferase